MKREEIVARWKDFDSWTGTWWDNIKRTSTTPVMDLNIQMSFVKEDIEFLLSELTTLEGKVRELDDVNTKLSEALGAALEDFNKAEFHIKQLEKENITFRNACQDWAILCESLKEEIKQLKKETK